MEKEPIDSEGNKLRILGYDDIYNIGTKISEFDNKLDHKQNILTLLEDKSIRSFDLKSKLNVTFTFDFICFLNHIILMHFYFIGIYDDKELQTNLKDKLLPCDNDFIFIMTETQQQIFADHPNTVMIDGTHGTNSSKFILISGLIYDARGEGYPIFQAIVKQETTAVIEAIFNTFSKTNPINFLKIKTIISDMSQALRTGIKNVIRHNYEHVLCGFHLLQC